MRTTTPSSLSKPPPEPVHHQGRTPLKCPLLTPSGHKPDRDPAVQRSPRKGAAPLRNEVHVEVLNALRASILGAHLNGEISPASLTKECGHTVVRLGCFLGCEGKIAEVGSLSRGAFCPEDEKLASILRGDVPG